jgi:hypothetical protein
MIWTCRREWTQFWRSLKCWLPVGAFASGFPEVPGPIVSARQFTAPDHDQNITRDFALRMVAPSASGQPGLLEEAAGPTLELCHASPQERPTGRSGAASYRTSRARVAADPSFCAWALDASAVSSPPVRRRFYQRSGGLSIWHSPWIAVRTVFRRRVSPGCYTHRLACWMSLSMPAILIGPSCIEHCGVL